MSIESSLLELQYRIDSLVKSNVSFNEILMLAHSANKLTNGKMSYVNSLQDLPLTDKLNGTIAFVNSSKQFVVNRSGYWYTMNGRFLIGKIGSYSGIASDYGRAYTWGNGAFGANGDNTSNSRGTPATAVSSELSGSLEFVKDISSAAFASAAIKFDGTLWTWGKNLDGSSMPLGKLGDGTTNNRSSPGTTAGGGTSWSKVSVGYDTMAAIKTDGTLWTWGDNGYGQLGNASFTDRSSPGMVAGGGTNWKEVVNSGIHVVALKTDGTLWAWGSHAYMQLGVAGGGSGRSSPVTVMGGITWKKVSNNNEGGDYTAAIGTDLRLYTWGANSMGQLGTGNLTARSSPGTTAGGGAEWTQVSCGGTSAGAIKTDGTLWTWGGNASSTYQGILGDGTYTNRSSPGTTAGGGNNWSYIHMGANIAAAIKTDGTLWTWGTGFDGVLGDGSGSGTTVSRNSPVSVATGSTRWSKVSGGGYHCSGITSVTLVKSS